MPLTKEYRNFIEQDIKSLQDALICGIATAQKKILEEVLHAYDTVIPDMRHSLLPMEEAYFTNISSAKPTLSYRINVENMEYNLSSVIRMLETLRDND
jgi:hypothetical protein